MSDPVGPSFIPKAALTAGRVLHQPFEIPEEATKSALVTGGVTHAAVGALNKVASDVVTDLKPRGPAKWLHNLFGRVDAAVSQSAAQAQKATEIFWVPFSNGAHQVGHSVSNPFALFYAKRAGFEIPSDGGALQALLAQVTDPVEGSTKFPGFSWPQPAPPSDEAGGTPPTGEEPPASETPPPAGEEPPAGEQPPAEDGSGEQPPSDDGGAPTDDGGAPTDDGGAPTDDGGAPTDDGGAPAGDGGGEAPAEVAGVPDEVRTLVPVDVDLPAATAADAALVEAVDPGAPSGASAGAADGVALVADDAPGASPMVDDAPVQPLADDAGPAPAATAPMPTPVEP